MFIGHYAVAPVAAATGKVKLWQAFIAVQLVDFVRAILNLVGVERTRIVENFTASNHVDLYHMPYSHSLIFTVFWAIVAGALFWVCNGGALIIAMLVISHWVLDVMVHAPDMTLVPGGEKFGFGLWNFIWLTLAIEVGFFIIAMLIYTRLTVPAQGNSVFWTLTFCAVLIGLQVYGTLGPVPASPAHMAGLALLGYVVITLGAWRYEETRDLYFEIVEDVYDRI